MDTLLLGQEEYEVTKEIMVESAMINACIEDLQAEKDGEHRYSKLARKYLPGLRKVKYHPEEAKWLIQEILEETTLPFSELDTDPYVDSYTGEEIPEPVGLPRDLQLQEDMRGAVRAAIFLQDHQVYFQEPSLEARIVQEASTLGYDPQLATKASQFDIYSPEDEDIWFINDNDPLPSVPLQQNEEQEYKVNPYILAEARKDVEEMVSDIRTKKQEIIKNNKNGKIDWDSVTALWEEYYSSVKEDFIAEMNTLTRVYDPQYAAVIYMAQQNDFFGVPASDARHVSIPGWGSLYDFISLFGDDILDEIIDPIPGMRTTEEGYIRKLASMIEKEVIDSQFTDDGDVPHTKAYARGVFGAIASNKDDLNSSGWAQWRWEKSKVGAIAYDATLKTQREDETIADVMRRSMAMFWKAVEIITLHKDGVTVLCPATNEEEKINYGLATWRYNNGYIPMDNAKKARLKSALAKKGWGWKLQQALGG